MFFKNKVFEAEGLGSLLESVGIFSAKIPVRCRIEGRNGFEAASRSPEATPSTILYVLNFCHTDRRLYLGEVVFIDEHY